MYPSGAEGLHNLIRILEEHRIVLRAQRNDEPQTLIFGTRGDVAPNHRLVCAAEHGAFHQRFLVHRPAPVFEPRPAAAARGFALKNSFVLHSYLQTSRCRRTYA